MVWSCFAWPAALIVLEDLQSQNLATFTKKHSEVEAGGLFGGWIWHTQGWMTEAIWNISNVKILRSPAAAQCTFCRAKALQNAACRSGPGCGHCSVVQREPSSFSGIFAGKSPATLVAQRRPRNAGLCSSFPVFCQPRCNLRIFYISSP